MPVNEDKNVGDAVVDRKTERGFTPGPWECDLSTNVIAGRFKIRQHFDGTATLDELKANARLIAAAPSLATFLMKIYLDYEADCGCECDSETCCAVMGEPCAKCHANVALLLLDQPADESAKRPISDRANEGQAS